MNKGLLGRIEKLEPTKEGRPHIMWVHEMSQAEIDAEIEARRADGRLGEHDDLMLIRWKDSDQSTSHGMAGDHLGKHAQEDPGHRG